MQSKFIVGLFGIFCSVGAMDEIMQPSGTTSPKEFAYHGLSYSEINKRENSIQKRIDKICDCDEERTLFAILVKYLVESDIGGVENAWQKMSQYQYGCLCPIAAIIFRSIWPKFEFIDGLQCKESVLYYIDEYYDTEDIECSP